MNKQEVIERIFKSINSLTPLRLFRRVKDDMEKNIAPNSRADPRYLYSILEVEVAWNSIMLAKIDKIHGAEEVMYERLAKN